ncbi:Holo-[acyl-carrier-protein] synthase [Fusobacterium necrogenes]|uniref:Holo-[acyl-carrier-protein] synthase n=1 Tax=Fusobacterium necrogenes TaxID=858 RepID=A0A377GYM4_9FUSO|nr:holo-ACP synthase [Fusobacterium necrogenes]STO31641.1 Holo-[acyl-carrier-protein] synthase [Fusobacterium necrogenes]
MIRGIGNDIVEIARIEKAIKNESFKKRVYTENEIELLEKKGAVKVASYAGRFSAKEAISKAMGTGVRGFNLIDIEILNDKFGKPLVVFKNELKEKMKNKKIELSISHSKEYATAVALILEKEKNDK